MPEVSTPLPQAGRWRPGSASLRERGAPRDAHGRAEIRGVLTTAHAHVLRTRDTFAAGMFLARCRGLAGDTPTSAIHHGERPPASTTPAAAVWPLTKTRNVLLRFAIVCVATAVTASMAHAEIVFKSSPSTSVDEGKEYKYDIGERRGARRR